AGPGAVDVHGRQRAHQVLEVGQSLLLDEVRGERGDALWNDLEIDLAARGRDDHLFERVTLGVGAENCSCRVQRCGNREGERRLGKDLAHQDSPLSLASRASDQIARELSFHASLYHDRWIRYG